MKFKEMFTEGLFSKEKDENFDFGESVLLNMVKKLGLNQKGKILDKSNQFEIKLNLFLLLKDEISYEQKMDIRDFLKKYKFKQNSASSPDNVEGKFYADGEEFIFMAGNNTFKKNTPYLRIYTEQENY